MSVKFYDRVYSECNQYYGRTVRDDFIRFTELAKVGGARALDLGCGQGRHSIYMARLGASVLSIDQSAVAVASLNSYAKKEKLGIAAIQMDVIDIHKISTTFQLCSMVTILDHLDRSTIPIVIRSVLRLLEPEGKIYVEAFTTADAGYTRIGVQSETSAPVLTYFEPGELGAYFGAFETLVNREFLELDQSHGEPHHHGLAVFIGKKA